MRKGLDLRAALLTLLSVAALGWVLFAGIGAPRPPAPGKRSPEQIAALAPRERERAIEEDRRALAGLAAEQARRLGAAAGGSGDGQAAALSDEELRTTRDALVAELARLRERGASPGGGGTGRTRRLAKPDELTLFARAVAPGLASGALPRHEEKRPMLDVNTATAEQLDAVPELKGHGFEIVRYREERGRFTSLRQLAEVPGLAQKTDGLEKRLRVR